MIYLSKTPKSVKRFRLVQKLWTCKVKSGNPAVNRHEERPQSGLRWFSRAQIPSNPSLEQGAVFHSRMSRKLLSTTIASTSVRVQMNSRRPRTAPWLRRLVRRSQVFRGRNGFNGFCFSLTFINELGFHNFVAPSLHKTPRRPPRGGLHSCLFTAKFSLLTLRVHNF